ncbi:MAG: hypothetical protein ACFFB0_11430 [Promethearchaeota archaeon]
MTIKYGIELDGTGIDTWGVDFVILNKNDEFVGYCYRYCDLRTKRTLNKLLIKFKKDRSSYIHCHFRIS